MTIQTAAAPTLGAYRAAAPQAAPSLSSPQETVTLSQDQAPRKGNIASGVALAVIGTGLVAAASIGIPSMFGLPAIAAVPTGTLLNGAMRFCGLLAFSGASDQWAQGDDNRVLRGTLLCAGGVLGMASAAGAFGHVGGLTAVAMGLGGFFTTLGGISKLSGAKSEA